jgi:hypothetical protein
VTAGEETSEHLTNDGTLTDDDARDLTLEPSDEIARLLEGEIGSGLRGRRLCLSHDSESIIG